MRITCVAVFLSLLACGDDDVSPAPDSGISDGGASDSAADATPASACGDGVVDEGEACDDGNTADFDGCNADCLVTAELRWETDLELGSPQAAWLFRGLVTSDGVFCAAGKVLGFTEEDSGSLLVCLDAEGNVERQELVSAQGTPFVSFEELPSGDFVALTGSFNSEGTELFRFHEDDASVLSLPEGLTVFQLQVVGDELLAVGAMGDIREDSVGWVGRLDQDGSVSETLHTNEERGYFAALSVRDDGSFVTSSRGLRTTGHITSFTEDGTVVWDTNVGSAGGGHLLTVDDTVRFFNQHPLVSETHSTLSWLDAEGTELGSERVPGDARNAALAPNGDTITLSYWENSAEATPARLKRFDAEGNERWSVDLPNEDLSYFEGRHVTVMPSGQILVVGAMWRRDSVEDRFESPRPRVLAFER